LKKKILVAEDNEKNRKVFNFILNQLDVDITEAVDGFKALELLKDNVYDLVLLDIAMPGKSGIDVIKEARQRDAYKNIPFIAITAFAMKGDKEKIMNAGFNDYMSKPIKLDKFMEKVKKYIDS
jgi:CheY-like chemotaxis protein